MFLSTGLKRVRLLGMGTHFFPKNLARGMLIRVGTFIRDTIVLPLSHYIKNQLGGDGALFTASNKYSLLCK